MKIIQRLIAPTPKFWRQVRNISGFIAGLAGTLLLLPISASTIGIVSAVFAITSFIAGFQTLSEKDLDKMTVNEILAIKDKLDETKKLNSVQKENLDMVNKYLEIEPYGA